MTTVFVLLSGESLIRGGVTRRNTFRSGNDLLRVLDQLIDHGVLRNTLLGRHLRELFVSRGIHTEPESHGAFRGDRLGTGGPGDFRGGCFLFDRRGFFLHGSFRFFRGGTFNDFAGFLFRHDFKGVEDEMKCNDTNDCPEYTTVAALSKGCQEGFVKLFPKLFAFGCYFLLKSAVSPR